MAKQDNEYQVSVGMPVYNGERFILKSLNSLLAQSYKNFELIISDNASTDNTPLICREYLKKDKRIKYVRQNKKIGAKNNFKFVLNEAKGKYFMWAAVDDLWEPSFIEKNVNVLESNKNVIGSISEVNFYGEPKWKQDGKNSTTTKFEKYRLVHPVSGPYRKKVEFYFKFRRATVLYSVFRAEELKQSVTFDHYVWDLGIIFSILKYGDIHVLDEILMHRYKGGTSSKGLEYLRHDPNLTNLKMLFMYFPFMKWCAKNLGYAFLLKNTSSFIRMYYIGYGRMTIDFIRWVKNIFKAEKHNKS